MLVTCGKNNSYYHIIATCQCWVYEQINQPQVHFDALNATILIKENDFNDFDQG